MNELQRTVARRPLSLGSFFSFFSRFLSSTALSLTRLSLGARSADPEKESGMQRRFHSIRRKKTENTRRAAGIVRVRFRNSALIRIRVVMRCRTAGKQPTNQSSAAIKRAPIAFFFFFFSSLRCACGLPLSPPSFLPFIPLPQ